MMKSRCTLKCLAAALLFATAAAAVPPPPPGHASPRPSPPKPSHAPPPKPSHAPPPSAQPADFVYHNGSIYTLDESSSKVDALAVKDGVIVFVGSNAHVKPRIGNKTKVVDLNGRTAIPGLVDAHMHVLSGGLFLLKCDLNYQPLGIEAILEHIQGCIDDETNKSDDAWVEVVNMDYPSLVTRSGAIGKDRLDSLKTDRPVILRSSDYHTVLVNSKALAVSDITADTPDPSNGKIERLPGSNEPSGVLQDSANALLTIPGPSAEENVQAGRAALEVLRQAGITTFQEAAAGSDHHELFKTIIGEDGLSARAYFDYRIEAPTVDGIASLVATTVDTVRAFHDNSTMKPAPALRWQAIKAFIDGVITYPANTAALIDPYWSPVNGTNETVWAEDPTKVNKPYWNSEILTRTLEGIFLAGLDAQLHVDGDLAVRIGLDAAESFRKSHPGHKFRLGLAHDELSHQDDWARFAQLEVDPIMSFQWAQLSSFYLPSTFESLGDYRLRNLQAYAQIEKAGRPVVYGSDWPVSVEAFVFSVLCLIAQVN
jgi:predicted amidohydrolase YtcJ